MSADKKGHLRISSFGNSLGISGEDIVLIPLGQLQEFRNHPFHVHDDERMEKLTESVREQGVLDQGKRTDLTFFHDGEKLDAHQVIADDSGESKSQVFRFLRLTELNDSLLQMTDRKEIGLVAAYELSYLRPEEQEILVHVIEKIRTMPSVKQAERLKKLSADGICTMEAIQAVLCEEPPKERRFVMKSKKLSEYFPEETTQEEIEEIIFGLLEQWRSSLSNGETA